MNQTLFNRIKFVYSSDEIKSLTPEQKSLVEKVYKNYEKNGAMLSQEKRQRLSEINVEIANLILRFEENILAENNNYTLHITNEDDLKGLPESSKEIARERAKNKGIEGWIFTLDQPSYVPFVTYVDNRELRKQMTIAYGSRCFNNNENDNKEIVIKICKLRQEKSKLLNHKTHAHLILNDRMAKDPETVEKFLNDIKKKAIPLAEKEVEELTKFAKELHGLETLEKWDIAYYSEKLKKKIFNFDSEELRPYFKLDNVIQGAFSVAERLYGIKFTEVNYLDKYNEDVLTYEVRNLSGDIIAYFYGDYFPRKEKKNGGWVYVFKPQVGDQIPYVGNFGNLPTKSETRPSLLSFDDVCTLFHEFGHGLHAMLSKVNYRSLSGINVLWDFLELPSQVMENWCYEQETLKLFAKHYQTNEDLPMHYVESIKASAKFQTGLNTLRQINYSVLDMRWHGENFPSSLDEIKKFEKELMLQFFPDVERTCVIVSFLHLFNSTYDYSAGYYSYMWAEVLDADAFERFKENGIFDQATASSFRENILSKGGSEHPMMLYKRYRGKEPVIEPFLKRRGLI